MPKIEYLDKTSFKKTSTEGDYRRSTGVFFDKIHIVTHDEELSGLVNVGHRYIIGRNQLEVYVDGQFKRCKEDIDGIEYGDYEEYSSFEILFANGIIFEGDQIRFRITWGTYNPMVRPPSDLQANLNQLAFDMFGTKYNFEGMGDRTARTIGEINSSNTPFPEIHKYRTWKITESVTIYNFLMGKPEDIRYIIFKTAATIQSNMNIRLEGNVSFDGNDGDTITLIFDGYAWRELSRSLNSL